MYTERTTISKIGAVFCVAYSDTRYSEPVRVTHHWPILCQDLFDDADIGKDARSIGAGSYTAQAGSGPFTGWKDARLRDGGQTKPIRTDEAPIPRPKTRVETRYQGGRWQKLLKARGWVSA